MKLTYVVSALLSAMAAASSCPAALQLMLDDGLGATVTVVDGGAADMHADVGAITWMGTLGAWSLNVSTGLGSPMIGSMSMPELDLNSINMSNAAGTLTLKLTQTGHVDPRPGVNALIGGVTDEHGALVYNTYADSSNLPFGTSESLTSQAFGPGAVSGTASTSSSVMASASLGSPYSLTQEIVITHDLAGTTSFNATVVANPEPAAVITWGGLALIGSGMLWRRRRRSA